MFLICRWIHIVIVNDFNQATSRLNEVWNNESIVSQLSCKMTDLCLMMNNLTLLVCEHSRVTTRRRD